MFSENAAHVSSLLRGKKIVIAGCGGLGSNAAALLVRAGADDLTLLDFDTVSCSNLNRQFYFSDQVGRLKTETLCENLKRIRSDVTLTAHTIRLNADNAENYIPEDADAVLECFDDPCAKAELARFMLSRRSSVALICASGIAGCEPIQALQIKPGPGKIILCGDGVSDTQNEGTFSARVTAAAALQVEALRDYFEKQAPQDLLLLCCCAPCSMAALEHIANLKIPAHVYFYNPNIIPENEHRHRAEEMARACRIFNLPCTRETYQNETWQSVCGGMEELPERAQRCENCFHLRLKAAFEFAKKNKFSCVSSVLGFSRWKDLNQVNAVALSLARTYDMRYWTLNWRKEGRQARNAELIKRYAIYEQSYCGCRIPIEGDAQ